MDGLLSEDEGRLDHQRCCPAAARQPTVFEPDPLVVYLLCSDSAQCARLAAAVERSARYQTIPLASTADLDGMETGKAQALIICQKQFRMLGPQQAASLARNLTIMVLTRREAFLDLGSNLESVQAVLLDEAELDRPDAIILEATRGYCLLPPFLAGGNAINELRLATLPYLGQQDIPILACLGRGMSNRQLAQTFAKTEAVVKSQVRNLLRRLRFRNRTEAAVFFSRYRARIQSAPAERPHH